MGPRGCDQVSSEVTYCFPCPITLVPSLLQYYLSRLNQNLENLPSRSAWSLPPKRETTTMPMLGWVGGKNKIINKPDLVSVINPSKQGGPQCWYFLSLPVWLLTDCGRNSPCYAPYLNPLFTLQPYIPCSSPRMHVLFLPQYMKCFICIFSSYVLFEVVLIPLSHSLIIGLAFIFQHANGTSLRFT